MMNVQSFLDPNLGQYCMIDIMFTRVLTPAKKDVVSLFSKQGGKLQLIVTTAAF